MKTLRSLLCFLLLMSASVFSGNAQTISREQAQVLASEFFAQCTRATRAVTPALAYQWDSRHLSPVATVAAEETAPAFYTFAPESGEGFVIISSDADNPRVLGYSLDSNLPDVQNLPDGMRDFLTEYSVAPAQTKQSRASYDYNATSMGNIVKYMETATWGQGAPYNNYCFTNDGQQAKTGCVPTAFAILMHYHKWPISAKERQIYHPSGTGDPITLGYEYNWNIMKNSYSSNDTSESAHQVATIMRDLGWLYTVSYGTDATSVNEGADKITDWYKYKSKSPCSHGANHSTVRATLNNDALWNQYIKESLDAGLPIPYSSTTTLTTQDRHIYILDGYTDNGYYHFNWGWSGSCNGWFLLSNMDTQDGSNYSKSHKAYFMLSPDRGEPCTITVSTDCGTCGTVSAFYGSTTGESIIVDQGANVTLTATPYSGYIFEKWTCGTEDVSTSATCKVSAEGDAEYVAHFKEIATIFYTVDVSSAEATFGLVKIDGEAATAFANKTVNHGTTVTLTAEAKDGYLFKNWTRDDEVVSIDNPWVVAVEENVSYKANFVPKQQGANITISTTTEGSGSVTINGESANTLAAKVNEEFTLAATPASGYYFVEWRVGDEVVSTKATVTTSAQTARTYKAVFAEKIGDVTIRVYKSGGGSALIGTATKVTVVKGEVVNITATPTENKKFAYWSLGQAAGGEIITNANPYSFVALSSKSYCANFVDTSAPLSVSATATAGAGGTASVTGDMTIGGEVTFKAKANDGYCFSHWENSNAEKVSTESYYSTVVASDLTLKPVFEVSGSTGPSTPDVPTPEVYNISVSVNGTNGTATASSNSVTQGEEVTLTATANDGYRFVNWTKGTEVVSSANPYTFRPTASGEYVANFEVIPVVTPQYTISVASNDTDYGTVAVLEFGTNTSGTVDEGTTLTLVATPKANCKFVKWTCNDQDIDGGATITVTADANKAYKAVFAVIEHYSVNVTANPTNGGTAIIWMGTDGSVGVNVQEGTTVTLQATANAGYNFVNWTHKVSGEVVSTEATFDITVNAAADYVANFEQVELPEVPSTTPEDGKAYVIYNIHAGAKKYMLSNGYSGEEPKLPAATDGATANYSNVFICRAIDVKQNKYAFVNAQNGQFMVFHGKKSNDPYTDTGFQGNYDNKCELIVTPSEDQDKVGYYTISGVRKRPNENGGWATMTINSSYGTMDANTNVNSPSYTDNSNFSSYFTFEEVLDYPNKVTLASFEGSQLITNLEGYTIGTFSAPFPTLISDGNVVAYYAEQVKGTEYVKLRAIATTAAIPAKQGVILVGTTAEITKALMVPATSEQQADLSSNLFKNSAGKKASMQEGDFILARGSQGIGFYPVNIDNSNGTEGTTLAMNKAFLRMGASNVAAFRLVVDEEVTAIDGVTTEKADAPIYDLSGRRVMQTVKGGVYIQNGKKFIVK
ncbi:MAG: C10 family peptidase [Bacteroidaceae bacterium]|nr:C10 family peptidase [Bacteroidaceae bacterium]